MFTSILTCCTINLAEGMTQSILNLNNEDTKMVDLNKIQATIETEINKATTAERKRIVGLVKEFAKDLVDAIQSGDDVEEQEAAPAKKTSAKKPAAKKAPAKKEEPVEEEETSEDEAPEAIDGNEYVDDIEDVEDDEVEESEYAGKKVGELRAICKERNITIPKGFKQADIAKLLILVDEDQE